jgi:zinc transporter ZupT
MLHVAGRAYLYCTGCSEDPVGELEAWHHMAAEEEEGEHTHEERTTQPASMTGRSVTEEDESKSHHGEEVDTNDNEGTDGASLRMKKEPLTEMEEENKKLVHMGINTALAIGLHNFPEGLATFVAALDDPSVGAVLAIAIGIHNVPEGLCVALPIYYATGNRWKAFLWACVSGISEPIAALLGWAILANSFSDTLYAVLFGLVAGMMVIISVKELIPTAHRYDPQDTVVTYSFIVGMGAMALSLALFMI